MIESSIFFKGHHIQFDLHPDGYKVKIQHTQSRHPVFVETLEHKIYRTKKRAIVASKQLIEGSLTHV